MKIFNQTKNTLLAENANFASTVLQRIKGLLGRKNLNNGEALILKPCNSIHTFFMRFPIGVLFVDKNNRVVKAINSLRPFRLTAIYFKAQYTIELPQGVIEASATTAGDSLRLE